MKNLLIILLIAFLTTISNSSFANSRWIDLEWDEVEGATGYDLSLSELIDGKEFPRGNFFSEKAHWSKDEHPGKYLVRIRALDKRKVPGPWGEAIPFNINLPNPKLFVPINETQIIKDENNNIIKFQWEEISKEATYNIIIYNSKNEIIHNYKTKEISYSIPINAIGTYYWSVKIENNFSENAEEIKKYSFQIKGEKLKSPILEVDTNDKRGLIIKWKEIFRAQKYLVSLSSLTQNDKQYFLSETSKTQIGIPHSKIPNDKLAISVKAKAKDYADSSDSRIIINKDNDLIQIVSNESIQLEQNYRPFSISNLSFSIGYPTVTYQNQNYETDTVNNQTLRGIFATLRNNFNFFEKNSIYTSFEIGQFADSYSNLNYFEIGNSYRRLIGNRLFNLQPTIGIKLKSLPNLSSNRLLTTKTITTAASKELGFILGLQVNKKWNENFENEIYFQYSKSLTNLNAKDKYAASNDMSGYFKLMYNINSQFNININYIYKNLTNKYKAQTGSSSYALPGDINSSLLKFQTIMFGSEFFY